MVDLDTVRDYKVLFVGDAIMDEYVYVHTIGKAVKENALPRLRGAPKHLRAGYGRRRNTPRASAPR